MKFKVTVILALATVALGLSIYFFDYKRQMIQALQQNEDSQIIRFDPEQINLIEIQKKTEKISLQKSVKGWTLLEPVQDQADNEQAEDFIKNLASEKSMAVAKEYAQITEADLKEYGLDQPLAVYNFKNNSGSSRKVAVGSQKNFEGNAFIRIDSENKVLVANQVWLTKADTNLIFFREKRLYRHQLAEIKDVQIKSLRDQFQLKFVDNKWIAVGHDYVLDQNKVREMLKKISAASIQEYVFESEPSAAVLKEKGLIKSPVQIKLNTAESIWSVQINQSEKDKALFALTDRPTSLLRLDITEWEFFGNLNLDSLRDRTSLMSFSLDEVKKIYLKSNDMQMNFIKENNNWRPIEPIPPNHSYAEVNLVKALNRLHDLEISEFVDKGSEVFKGSHMIILKTDSDRLVYQLNWGPEVKLKRNGIEKDYFYARTQAEPVIFAIEKEKIESLDFKKIFQKISVTESSEPKKEDSSQ